MPVSIAPPTTVLLLFELFYSYEVFDDDPKKLLTLSIIPATRVACGYY